MSLSQHIQYQNGITISVYKLEPVCLNITTPRQYSVGSTSSYSRMDLIHYHGTIPNSIEIWTKWPGCFATSLSKVDSQYFTTILYPLRVGEDKSRQSVISHPIRVNVLRGDAHKPSSDGSCPASSKPVFAWISNEGPASASKFPRRSVLTTETASAMQRCHQCRE
jgi:hypothetical protein